MHSGLITIFLLNCRQEWDSIEAFPKNHISNPKNISFLLSKAENPVLLFIIKE